MSLSEQETQMAKRYAALMLDSIAGELECFPALFVALTGMLVYFLKQYPGDKITVIDAVNKDLRRELLKQAV